MCRRLCLVLFVVLVTSVLACQCFAVEISAESSVLIEQKSGRILFEKAAHEERLIASITKIMTAVVALEYGDLGKSYTITAEDMAEGSSMYLKPGETLTLEELLYGLMLASGNDAALAVAHCVSGELAEFVTLMNETASKLGMHHSSFANPNGLDQKGHYSTAQDMAVLAAYALNNERFRRIVSTDSITIGERYLKNHNKLLTLCEGCIGVKTGYTKAAGRTLVSAVERQGMTLVCVTLKDGNDWNDHMTLFDYGFSSYHLETAVKAGYVLAHAAVTGGKQAQVKLVADADFLYPLKENEKLTVCVKTPVSLSAPLMAGQRVGSVSVYLDGAEVGSIPLVVAATIEIKETGNDPGFLQRFFFRK